MSKVGRNDRCPCGSGKKYKQCHGVANIASPSAAARPNAAQMIQTALNLHQAGMFREAEAIYKKVLEFECGNSDAMHFLGYMAYQDGKIDIALDLMRRSILIKPSAAQYHSNLGVVLLQTNHYEEAERELRHALTLGPSNADATNNLGTLYQIRGDLDSAIGFFHQAIAIKPDYIDALINRASVYLAMGRPDDAVLDYLRALDIDSGHAGAHYSYGFALLRLGCLRQGWDEYESRFDARLSSRYRVSKRQFPAKPWQGQTSFGRGLLVWQDQGVGDGIWSASMLPELLSGAAEGGRVLVECAPKLVALFMRSFAKAEVVARQDPPDPRCTEGVDYQIAGASLGRYLRLDLDNFPQRKETAGAYLFADPEREQYWKQKLGTKPGLKVGVCWRSTNIAGERALACTRLTQWGEIFKVPGIELVNLQYDESELELKEAEAKFGISIQRYPEVDMFNDLDETAALMRGLDLVISAPTAVSVLSAAVGVPTWQLNYCEEWQHLGLPNNPWYPVMRNYPRRWDQPWEEILAKVAGDLAGWVR